MVKTTLCHQKSLQDCEPIERDWCVPCQQKLWEGTTNDKNGSAEREIRIYHG